MSEALIKLLADEDFILSLIEHMQVHSKAEHLTVITKLLIAKGLYFDVLRAALQRYPPDSEFRTNNPLATLIGRYFVLHGRDFLKSILKPAISKLKEPPKDGRRPSDNSIAADLITSAIEDPTKVPESLRFCLYSAFRSVISQPTGSALLTARGRGSAASIVVGSLFFLRFVTPAIIDSTQWTSKDYGLKPERMALAKAVQNTTNALASHEQRKLSLSEEDLARFHVLAPKFERFAVEMVSEPKNTRPVSTSHSWSVALQQKRDVDSVLLYVHHHREALLQELRTRPAAIQALRTLLQEREMANKLYGAPT